MLDGQYWLLLIFCPLYGGGSGNTRKASSSLGHLNKGLYYS